ncbi:MULTISPECIES: TraY domain-containing protein [Vibrio]|uniref:TraY domain-containing protein n=1 Tax=Vibrio TaxID=662 RepID=UPI0015B4292F|nr:MULTISPECIES: TraY domain-containing protein [Vibrio]MBD1576943.1 TraY domain-containing protein [Vibrio sp. S11_S32]
MNSKQQSVSDVRPIGIQFDISAEANAVLIESAKKAERTKKGEAKLRLQDHLLRFPDWKQQ